MFVCVCVCRASLFSHQAYVSDLMGDYDEVGSVEDFWGWMYVDGADDNSDFYQVTPL